MTTRRRLMGAGLALGLIPARTFAQTTEYQCGSSQTTGNIRVGSTVSGTYKLPSNASGSYVMKIPAEDIRIDNGLHIYGDPPTAEITFAYERFNVETKELRPLNVQVYLGTMRADQPTDEYSVPNVTTSFLGKKGKVLAQFDARLTSASSGSIPPTKIVMDAGKDLSLFGLKADAEAAAKMKAFHDAALSGRGKKLRILFHAMDIKPDPKTAMAVIEIKRPKAKEMMDAVSAAIAPQVDKLKAGNCPEKVQQPCFLTTASSHALGLPDDCWELQTLRAFRDGPLPELQGGKELIQRYYAEAQAIVEALPVSEHRALWARTWLTGVLPAALFCRLGWHKLALRHYHRMFNALSEAIS